MKVVILSSGSEGNSIFIEENGARILIDAGISRRRIVNNLRAMEIDPKSIEAVFLTHEHYDHTAGLKSLCKYEKYPVFSSEGTIRRVQNYVPKADFHQTFTDTDTKINGLNIKSISVPHDAVEPQGFVIEGKNSRLLIATDLGYVTENINKEISNCSAVILESNHDLDMLNNGPYPQQLKQRILSRWGHLSNKQCALAIGKSMWKGLELVILAHLSRENNHPEIARNETSKILNRGIKLKVADRREITGPFEL